MREALDDPEIFGTVFAGESWSGWRVLLIAMMGEELTDAERAISAMLTGRSREPGRVCEEFWAIVGRRGGKTRAVAVAAVYLAVCVDWADVLAPGERGLLPIMAASTRQAAKALGYISGMFASVPHLAAMKLEKQAETADTIRLRNQVDIEVTPANWRTVRSMTAIAAIVDEIAFWRSEDTANPDSEILNAIRPALATTGGPLISITSPYAKRGEAYGTFRRHFGPAGDPAILVARAASRTMNPLLPQSVVDRAYERDASAARAEYGGEFRDDLEDFVSREVVEAVVDTGVKERAPVPGVKYVAFIDPAGGSGQDAMTLAIGHVDDRVAVIDATRERVPPFSPSAVVDEFTALLRRYGLSEVRGDRYAGEFVREPFRARGITYRPSEKSKVELYRDFLPVLNSGQVRLLDDPRLVSQLCSLERRVSRGGRDSIDHPPGGHDDLANVVAGVAQPLLVQAKPSPPSMGTYVNGRIEMLGRPAAPEWFERGDLYPPGDPRWKLPQGQRWLAERALKQSTGETS